MATVPTSNAGSKLFKQSEGTAARRTWVFHLTKAADGTDCTGVVPVMTISKAGGAFAAVNGGTAITELTNGWYKVVHNAADLDTFGDLGVHVAVATADTLHVTHQVVAFDPYDASALGLTAVPVALVGANLIDTNSLKADAITKIQAGMATHADVLAVVGAVKNTTVALGTLSADGASKGVSAKNASTVIVTVTGTFGSGSAQPQVCADPAAASPVWVNSGTALTSNGSKTITGPVNAVRVNLTGSTSPSLVVTAEVSVPQSAV